MKSNVISLLLAFSLIFFFSCRKGDQGPAGPAGATGATGAAGATGSPNVFYSDWATVNFTLNNPIWTAAVIAPKLTRDILDKGIIKTYFKSGTSVFDGNYTGNLPDSYIIPSYAVGVISLMAGFNASGSWRYVIIPGGLPGGRVNGNAAGDSFVLQDGTVVLKSELDNMSYGQVCRRFNIPE